ncbi:MAG: CocE/NonD family hydrolase [Planctomycetaceae bacterium]
MHRPSILALFAILLFASASPAEKKVDLGDVTEKHVMVPMRDGVKLSAYLYFPKGKGPWPVLMEQRYASLRGSGTRRSMARLARYGYVVAVANFRGAQRSEGTWVGYRALGWGRQQDGYDLVEWMAKRPWSTGKVGSFGSSQGGFAQNFLAVTQPPHLKAQYMIDTGLSLFHEGYRIGGATKPNRFKGMDRNCRVPAQNRALMAEWFRHPTYDEYWQAEDCTRHFDKMNVPCFTIGSWYDYMNVGSIQSFIGRQHRGGKKSRGRQQLRIGPWLHGRYNKSNRVGEMTYPKNAAFDIVPHMVRWFDHHLKGVDNGVMADPAVRYYVMGAVGETNAPGNVWRTAKDWPVASTPTPYYFQAGGRLSTVKPAGGTSVSAWNADPRNPVSIPGRAFPGARDARAVERQKNVLTFTTESLKTPVEWTGKVTAELYVQSTAKDTDFIVRVSDVYPDGRSILIVDMIRRARYRNGFTKEVFLKPGQVHKVKFSIGWLSQIFNRGHRIRITVCSTGAPFYEPNPNTGEPLTIEFPKTTVVAKNNVHHNRKYASHVIAPMAATISNDE